jgi:small membrane protein
MIFQLFLSAGLFFIAVYAFTQKVKSPFVGIVTLLCALAAFYFVWAPNSATTIAHMIGVGRGADLIFYCWGLISFLLLLNLHFKVLRNLELVTALARKIAIAEAERQAPSDHRNLT